MQIKLYSRLPSLLVLIFIKDVHGETIHAWHHTSGMSVSISYAMSN